MPLWHIARLTSPGYQSGSPFGRENIMSAETRLRQLPVIDVSGSHLEIGRAIGETLREGFRAVADSFRAGLDSSIGWDQAMAIVGALLPYAEAHLPGCTDEIRGMADGSGLEYTEIFAMNAMQETLFLARHDATPVGDHEHAEGCTSLAVTGDMTANGHVLLAHNEDASPIRNALPYVVRARPDDEPAFVGFAYSALLLYQGMNDRGIGSVGNALYARDIHAGTPKLLAYRDVLGAPFLEDAIRRTQRPHRANGNNHLLANTHGEIYDVEVTGRDSALFAPDEAFFVHTNHMLDPRLRSLETSEDVLNSMMRQKRVERRLYRMRGQLTVERVFEILSDHSNYPRSVCKHFDEVHNTGAETVGSVVVDLTAGEIHVRAGHPCESESTKIGLNA